MGKEHKVERRKERELALWGIFQTDFGKDDNPASKLLENFKDEETFKDLKSITGGYADEVVGAFQKNSEAVDSLIEERLRKNWSLKKLAKADKAILRLAITEMLMTPEPVPKEIAINEAVELAKKYGGDKSSRFINGILNEVANEEIK